MNTVYIKEFDYVLPIDQIAEYPLQQRDASRLLVYQDGNIKNENFSNLANHLPEGATLVLNDTRVIEARLFFQKQTGAHIEVFCLCPHQPASIEEALNAQHDCLWNCLIGGASKWTHGLILKKEILIDNEKVVLNARFVGKSGDQFIVGFNWESKHLFSEVLQAAGSIPLPPYIKRKVEAEDQERYQTVFAKQQGSVAAPTAALHFTDTIFTELTAKGINRIYVTLHVGAGTFKPVKTETIEDHPMHSESFSVSVTALKHLIASKNIIAVGTTSLRTLESLYWIGIKLLQGNEDFSLQQWEAYSLDKTGVTYKQCLQAFVTYLEERKQEQVHCETSLLIRPGYTFQSASALITNFHQPKSTLLLLVAAFIGQDWKKVYNHAINNDYRFLSYGDSSLLWKNNRIA